MIEDTRQPFEFDTENPEFWMVAEEWEEFVKENMRIQEELALGDSYEYC